MNEPFSRSGRPRKIVQNTESICLSNFKPLSKVNPGFLKVGLNFEVSPPKPDIRVSPKMMHSVSVHLNAGSFELATA